MASSLSTRGLLSSLSIKPAALRPAIPALRSGPIRRSGNGTPRSENGTAILTRPVRPDDEHLYPPFLAQVSQEDLRLRFFAPVKEFGHAFIARFTQLDYARAMAFVAIEEATGNMLGVVRLHADANYDTAEYAVLVRSDLKGEGLGWQLMQLIIEYARSEGLREIEGQVLYENSAMLRMCAECGFSIAPDPHGSRYPYRDAAALATLDTALSVFRRANAKNFSPLRVGQAGPFIQRRRCFEDSFMTEAVLDDVQHFWTRTPNECCARSFIAASTD